MRKDTDRDHTALCAIAIAPPEPIICVSVLFDLRKVLVAQRLALSARSPSDSPYYDKGSEAVANNDRC